MLYPAVFYNVTFSNQAHLVTHSSQTRFDSLIIAIHIHVFSFTVSSDGAVTREDDTSPLTTSHSRFEVVQVNALTTQDIFNNQSTVQGTPSYIIQAPAGQTYIIQQPTGNLVRQTHTGELTAVPEGLDSNQHDQVRNGDFSLKLDIHVAFIAIFNPYP